MLIASWIAFIGLGSPILPATGPPAACSSSGTARARTSRASSSGWSSGSITLARPPTVLGTSSVKLHGPRAARWRTASISAGVAAVLCATTRTRVGSMARSLSRAGARCGDARLVAHLAEDALQARLGLVVDVGHRRRDRGVDLADEPVH